MLSNSKRSFILRTSSLIALSATGIMSKVSADWDESLFAHKPLDELLNSLTKDTSINESDAINIKAPEIAENGAVVPITVSSSIPSVNNISIIVDNNPSPLTSSFAINPQLEAYVATRVKMAESSNIIALVKTEDNKFFTASKSIKVTIGGCGG